MKLTRRQRRERDRERERQLRAQEREQEQTQNDERIIEPPVTSERRETIRLWIEIAGIAGLIATVLYNRDSVNELRRQVTQSQVHFIEDQRPLMWLETDREQHGPDIPFEKLSKEPLKWKYAFANFGKSAAFRVTHDARIVMRPDKGAMVFGPDAWPEVEKYFLTLPPTLKGEHYSVAMPGVRAGRVYELRSSRPFNSGDVFHQFATGDYTAVLVGRIEYEDGLGIFYQSDFCQGLMGGAGGVEDCPKYNEIRRGRARVIPDLRRLVGK